jgi:putative heme-binding domain-containing protein
MRLKVGIVAVLARSGDPQSLAYLRDIWEMDPERRPAVALGLAQTPNEKNWEYLIRSLPVVEDGTAREVMRQLMQVDLAPEEPEYYRQVILHGLELGDDGADTAIELLEHWLGDHLSGDGDWKSRLTAWQKEYSRLWPDALPAEPYTAGEDSKWKYKELQAQLIGSRALSGSVEAGAELFTSARCADCHRFGDVGAAEGPELTTVGQRLMKKQVLQAMLHPSHTVPSRYLGDVASSDDDAASLSDESDDASDSLASTDAESEASGTRARPTSPMPEGLLDDLTLDEIVDLFAYLTTPPNLSLAERPGDEPVR